MRNALFAGLALVLVLAQANAFRIVGPAGLHGFTPALTLPLIIFLGVHEHSMTRGAVLAFVIGHLLDLFASAPVGMFAFVSVALWWLARVAGVRLAAQTAPTQMVLAFGFSLIQSVVVLVLLVVFGGDPQRPVELARLVFPHAAATALLSPLVFALAERVNVASTAGPRAGEGG